MKRILPVIAALAMTQSACIVAGGYSNRGGWFLWPGSLGSLIIIALLLYFLSRRR